MKAEIIAKKSGSRRHTEDTQRIVLDRPSVIVLKLAPENVARYERHGDDLVLLLKDGREITIPGFFAKYPEGDSAEQASADAAHATADGTPAEGGHGRNELVLEDDSGVTWWGQYPDQWSEFHFTEIEWNDGGFVWSPWPLGALGGIAAGTLAVSSGGRDGGNHDNQARPPVADDDSASGGRDGGPITGNVLANDRDPGGDALTVTGFTIDGTTYSAGDTASIAGVGTFTIGKDGGYSFTPEANWSGTVPTVTYTISNGKGGTDTADLVITITPATDLTAADDSATTDEDTPVSGTVATNDQTASGGDLTFAKASDPGHGAVVFNPDGSYTYTPDANYNGPDSFTYTVTDPASGESLTQTVTITVTPVNDAPTAKGAIADRISEDAQSDTSLNVVSYFSDVDGDTLTYGASGLPTGLTIDPTTGIISGTIDHSASQGGAAGVYNVTVTATSSDGGSVNQTFTWTVTNPAPVANDDAATTNEDMAVSGNVLSSGGPGDVADSDPDGDPLRVTGFTVAGDPTPHGAGDTVIIAGVCTLTLDVDGAYSFTPTADRNGTVPTVTYAVSDDEGGTDTADLVITVAPVADLTAADDSTTTPEDTSVNDTVAGNDSTTSGGTLTFAKASDPEHGSVIVNGDGTYTYTPDASYNGPDSFTYTVTDPASGESLTQTVTITVNPVNDAPVIAGGDQSGAVTEAGNLDDGTVVAGDPDASGSFTASDVDGDALTWSVAGTPDTTYGTFSIDAATGAWSYALDNTLPATQALNEGDTVSLTYDAQVSDGNGGTATRSVTITITGTNDSPVANGDTATVTESGVLGGGNTPTAGIPSVTDNVLTNDTDVDDGEKASLTVSEVSFGGSAGTIGAALTGTYGSLVLNSDGGYTYTLDNDDPDTQPLKQGDTATEVFTYTAVDVNGATTTSTLTITVTGTNDRPVITSTTTDATGDVTEAGTTVAGVPTAAGTLTASDVDTGATQTWSLATTNGTYGTIDIDPATGEWTYTLDDTRPATQTLNDGDTGTETFTARVTDEFGAYSEQVVTITVHGSNDDLAGTGNATVSLAEDGSASGTLQDYVSDVDDTLKVTGFTVDADGDGTDESHAPGDTVTIMDADGNTLGTLTIAEDGDYSFTPAANYAGGAPTVTYTMVESGGAASVIQTLDFEIAKVADAPDLEADKTVSTNEDTAVSLGLIAPVITDTGTGTTNNDFAERLGAITLTIGGAGASGVTLSTGAMTLTPVAGEVTIVLTDSNHVPGVPAEDNANGVYYLTTAQYQALEAHPLAESGADFTVTVGATSYEVDSAGAIVPGVAGATSTQTIAVDVLAVTDGASLASSATASDLIFAEDETIDLSPYLTATLTSGDANPGNDTDGSETYWYTVSDLPNGTVVTIDGVATIISAAVPTATSVMSASATPPTITITPPANYSGDIDDVTITLNTQDTDGDSSGTIATITSSVTLDLHVTPVAGDVSAGCLVALWQAR